MTKLHFNYKDLFRAFRLGFSAKKIWVGFVGLLFGWLGYSLMGYVAYFATGTKLAAIWETFRLFPMPNAVAGIGPAAGLAWLFWLLWAVGVAWLVLVAMISGIVISKLTYEQLRGDEFYEVKEAWKQGIKSAGALIATPILLGLFIVLLLCAGLLLGLIGRIPYAGEIIVGVLAIPAFAVSLFIVYLAVVFVFTFSIGPAVIGTTKSDAFDNLFEVFSCVNDQPWRLIWYQLLLGIFAVVGMAFLAFASVKALQLGRWIVGILMNVSAAKSSAQVLFKLDLMINGAADYVRLVLPAWLQNVLFWLPVQVQNAFGWIKETVNLPSLIHTENVVGAVGNWSVTVGTILLAITYHCLILFVLGFGSAIWYSGNTLVYLILVRKKDDRNLLEIKDEEVEIPEKLEAETPAPEAKPKRTAKAKKAPAKKPAAKKPKRG
ncbi:hypothetical protein GX441_04480 [bacterium]|nr:hypothetical protein [bacterium]